MAEFVLTGQEVFGRYARIAYGHAVTGKQDYHIYKCIQLFRSNCYCDTPLTYQTENDCHIHSEIVDVVNVIHCGIDESKVIRVALKDIELLPKAKTNADRIRAMSDEEMAAAMRGCPDTVQKCPDIDCADCWLDWLRQEAT